VAKKHANIREGKGREVKERILKELRTPAAIAVIMEGNIPVHRKLRDDETRQDMELLIFPLGRLPETREIDWDDRGYQLIREPSYEQRRSHQRWVEEREERSRRRDAWFKRQETEECQASWEWIGRAAERAEEEWIREELLQTEPEWVNVEQDIDRMHQAVEKKVRPKAGKYRQAHQDLVAFIPEDQYQQRIKDFEGYAKVWSPARQHALTDAVQRIDRAKGMMAAEELWKKVLKNQLLAAVDQEVMYARAREIRINCMNEEQMKHVMERMWIKVRSFLWNQATTTTYIRDHLMMYVDQKEWILNELNQKVLKEIMITGCRETRNFLWNRMLALVCVTRTPKMHIEHRLYKLWWIAFGNEKGLMSAEIEWNRITDYYTWENFQLSGHSFRDCIRDRIRKTPGGQVPRTLWKLSQFIELEDEQRKDIIDFCFRELEGVDDFAKGGGYWPSIKHSQFRIWQRSLKKRDQKLKKRKH
jgi:hypothetical protein